MSSEKQFDVAVIGGGIGGLCMAIALQAQGIPFHIYESAHKFSEIGAGVALGPNAQRAMTLIDPRIKAGYDARQTDNQFEDKKDVYFQFRMGMDYAGRKANDLVCESGGPGHGMSIIHRAHFLDELIKLVPADRATFGKRVHAVDSDDAGVTLHFNDDSAPARHSIAIGCDGIKSDVRRHLFGSSTDSVFSGKYAYRGLLPMEKAVTLLGSERQAKVAQNYIGDQGHVLTMAIEKGAVMNVVAFHTAEHGEWMHGSKWVVPLSEEQMDKDFRDWSKDVKTVLSLMHDPDMWALFECPPLKSYFKDRTVLIGDAAHATTPHQGAGAGAAICDAYILGSLLGLLKTSGNANDPRAIAAVFGAYDAVRREKTQKLVRTSHEAGELFELHAEGFGADLDKLSENVNHRWEWIWNEDLQAELGRAKGSLRV